MLSFVVTCASFSVIAAYLVSLFEDTNLAAIHAKRVTMYVCSSRLLLTLLTHVLYKASPRILLSPVACVASALKSDNVRLVLEG